MGAYVKTSQSSVPLTSAVEQSMSLETLVDKFPNIVWDMTDNIFQVVSKVGHQVNYQLNIQLSRSSTVSEDGEVEIALPYPVESNGREIFVGIFPHYALKPNGSEMIATWVGKVTNGNILTFINPSNMLNLTWSELAQMPMSSKLDVFFTYSTM